MQERDRQRASKRLRTAIELHESGIAMKRAQLRRAFPEMADRAIEREVAAWLSRRSGAEFGDVAMLSSDVSAVRR